MLFGCTLETHRAVDADDDAKQIEIETVVGQETARSEAQRSFKASNNIALFYDERNLTLVRARRQ